MVHAVAQLMVAFPNRILEFLPTTPGQAFDSHYDVFSRLNLYELPQNRAEVATIMSCLFVYAYKDFSALSGVWYRR
jgi:hypothetical protein